MSPLTKLFVVLLVITSLLTTAGFVVFVTNVPPVQELLNASKNELAAANAREAAADHGRQAAEAQFAIEQAAHNQDVTALSATNSSLEKQVSDDKVNIAKLQADNTTKDAMINTLGGGNGVNASNVQQLLTQNDSLRAANEKYVQEADASNRRIDELDAQVDTLRTTLQNAQDQLRLAMDTEQKYAGFIKDHGGDPDVVARGPGAISPIGEAPINGVVQVKQVLNGDTMVQLNVGKADGVRDGTKFNILDGKSGEFLAIATVTDVESNMAIARLNGDADKVARVTVGSDAKTNLRGQ